MPCKLNYFMNKIVNGVTTKIILSGLYFLVDAEFFNTEGIPRCSFSRDFGLQIWLLVEHFRQESAFHSAT